MCRNNGNHKMLLIFVLDSDRQVRYFSVMPYVFVAKDVKEVVSCYIIWPNRTVSQINPR